MNSQFHLIQQKSYARLLWEIHQVGPSSLFKILSKGEMILPWLVWLSGLSTGLQTERSPVRLLVRARAWVPGQVPVGGVWGATDPCFFPSFSPSFPFSLKVNKICFFLKKRNYKYHTLTDCTNFVLCRYLNANIFKTPL